MNKKVCPICSECKIHNDFHRLSCGHEFCKECLEKEFTLKINSANWKNIKCCLEKCGQNVNYYEIKGIVDKNTFEKYDQMLSENLGLFNDNEQKITCPSCNTIGIISKGIQRFTCGQCKGSFCSQQDCLGNWKDHQNLSCKIYQEKFLKEQKSKNIDQEFSNYISEKKIKPCPKCKAVIEKTRNCNYVTCESNICQKKTTFCYICGDLLNNDERNTHYIDNNYYNKCNEKMRIQLKELRFQKCNEEISCPLCGNNEHSTLELNVEKNYKICKCTSLICKEKWFCLDCKEKIDNNLITQHINGKCLEIIRIKKLGFKPICPGCSNSDEIFFDLPENLNNNIFICHKEGRKIYCLLCKKTIQEIEILDHANKKCRNDQPFDEIKHENNIIKRNINLNEDKKNVANSKSIPKELNFNQRYRIDLWLLLIGSIMVFYFGFMSQRN